MSIGWTVTEVTGGVLSALLFFFHSKQALLGLFDHNFSYLIMPRRGLNPRQSVSQSVELGLGRVGLAPDRGLLKDTVTTELQRHG